MEENQRKVHPTSKSINKPATTTMPIVPRNASNRGCLCRVICCIISLLILFIIAIGISALVFYLVLHPKVPDYQIDWLRITDFRLNLDLSLYAKFNARVTAKNSNKKIGIYYEQGGKMSVWYEKTELCQGAFPEFYQDPLNTTRLEVSLEGQNQFGSALMKGLQQQQQTGNVPLDLKVDQPVAVRVKSRKLRKVRFLVKCKLTVDSVQ